MMSASKVLTFDDQPPKGTINFGIGQPSADLLPLGLVERASRAFFENAQPLELNYGVLQGDARFLESLALFLTDNYGSSVNADNLFVSAGNSQSLDMSSWVFTNPGDTVFVEEPSYFLAFQIFRDHDLNIVGIPTDNDGLCIDSLQQALQKHTPAFLYTVSSYHNPGGQSTSEARRRTIVELACKHNFLILADEVYQLLYFSDPPPPAYGTMVDSDRVVSLGSFSKILAPGLRLGWVHTSERLRKKLRAAGYVNSGGSLNQFTSHIVRQVMDDGSLAAHIDELRKTYGRRAKAMDDALHQHFDGIAEWTRPGGGYFFWVCLKKPIDTSPLKKLARERETGFQPGTLFSTRDNCRNCLRLSFAHYNEDDIRKGIARLRTLFD